MELLTWLERAQLKTVPLDIRNMFSQRLNVICRNVPPADNLEASNGPPFCGAFREYLGEVFWRAPFVRRNADSCCACAR